MPDEPTYLSLFAGIQPEDSTSPSKPTGSGVSDRSSSTPPAQLSLPDTGPVFRDGEMSMGSPLLPTPHAGLSHSGGTANAKGQLQYRAKYLALTSSSAGSHVSPSATPASEEARTTSDTSGRSSGGSSLSFDLDWSSSRTSLVCSLSGGRWVTEQGTLLGTTPLATFSGTWPKRGSMRGGSVYAHPTSARHIGESASSSSLNVPTPTASDSVWGDKDHSRRGIVGNHNLGLTDWVKTLPTPQSWLGRRPAHSEINQEPRQASEAHEGDRGRRSVELTDALSRLLPTPRTPTGGPEPTSMRRARGNVHGTSLEASLGDLMQPPSDDGSG